MQCWHIQHSGSFCRRSPRLTATSGDRSDSGRRILNNAGRGYSLRDACRRRGRNRRWLQCVLCTGSRLCGHSGRSHRGFRLQNLRSCGCWSRARGGRRTCGVPSLGGSRGHRAFTQLLAGCFTSPRAGIDVPHGAQPLLGFLEGREEPHVQPKPLASFLEPPAHEEAEALQLLLLGPGQREWRGR